MRIHWIVVWTFCVLFFIIAAPSQAAEYNATIKFAHRITMSLPVNGQVNIVAVQPGQSFKQGQTLLALDLTPYNSEVTQSQAEVTKQNTEIKEAGRDYSQLKELFDRGVLSSVELENGQLKLQRVKAALKAADAKLTQAKYNLAHAMIVAPFDGWVLDVNVSQNETINNNLQSQPLLVVAEANKYIARILVPIGTVHKIKIGDPARVVIGNRKFSGTIAVIGIEPESTNKESQLYAVDIKFSSKGLLIRPGQPAKIVL